MDNRSNTKKAWTLRKKIIIGIVSVITAAIIGLAIYIIPPLVNPMGQFETVVNQTTPQPSVSATETPTVAPSATATVTPSPTLDPYGELAQQGDFSILQNTVNILLIGTDYAPERADWHGKHSFHSDVMIVLSINKETNQVSLISLPRDTYAQIPADPDGIYKLNASINCGGKPFPDPKACEQVCKAASWMIGGIPINYYYAVDMQAVKDLVNSIGGVDFDVDIAFTQNHRSYKKGMQHMDGQAVLDYMRIRKAAYIKGSADDDQQGDLHRINRQKNMLVAIFQKIKDSGLLTQIPTIVSTFDSKHLVTNVSFAQTAALASYSLNVNSSDIKLYSMDGSGASMLFHWNFVITDQDKRVSILKKVFGVDIRTQKDIIKQKFGVTVPSYANYDISSAYKLWEKMQISVTGDLSRNLLDKIKIKLDADALLDPEPTDSPTTDPTTVPTTSAASKGNAYAASSFRKYPEGGKEWTLYNTCEGEYEKLTSWNTSNTSSSSARKDFNDLITQFHKDMKKLAGYFSIKLKDSYWTVIYNKFEGKINQSYVKDTISVDFN